MSIVLILTTVADGETAELIARALVDERLAACVSVSSPMTSTYRWRGAIEQASERQLVIKTVSDRVPALEARLIELHPYEVPEFVVVGASEASDAYLAWVRENTKSEV
jgi:periplasmic divalent cation tolerance protein